MIISAFLIVFEGLSFGKRIKNSGLSFLPKFDYM